MPVPKRRKNKRENQIKIVDGMRFPSLQTVIKYLEDIKGLPEFKNKSARIEYDNSRGEYIIKVLDSSPKQLELIENGTS